MIKALWCVCMCVCECYQADGVSSEAKVKVEMTRKDRKPLTAQWPNTRFIFTCEPGKLLLPWMSPMGCVCVTVLSSFVCWLPPCPPRSIKGIAPLQVYPHIPRNSKGLRGKKEAFCLFVSPSLMEWNNGIKLLVSCDSGFQSYTQDKLR